MKRLQREWMYERLDSDTKKLRVEFVKSVQEFINYAKQQPEYKSSKQIRCPCEKCKNKVYLVAQQVQSHLGLKGFCDGYYDWVCHGENFPVEERVVEERTVSENPYRDMVEDALRDGIDQIREEALNAEVVDESPNPLVRGFFEMLRHAEQPVYEGTKFTVLQSAARLITLKCEFNLPHKCVDRFISYIRDIIPDKSAMTRNFYETKKVLRALQLPCEKIDACEEGCMLFWEDDVDLDKCKKCGKDRYKCKTTENGKKVPKNVLTYFPLGPRLQRFYATKHIAGQMRWHYENPRVSGIMSHPSDSEAWKHFDQQHPQFSSEPRNIRLGLCTDGFQPFGAFGKSYSCWPVMVTPYNLPPWLCMKRPFIILSLLIPGPKNPKQNLDIYLQPLVKELKELWSTGLFTYDVSRKQNFILRAALLWTINDFPAYGMLSGWTTAGEHACPYCMEKDTKSFWLKHGKKWSWFDCHRQQLSPDHVFRKDKIHFRKDRPVENDVASTRLDGYEVWECVKDLPKIVDASDGELKRLKEKRIGWWKQSIFWELPYWKTLLIRHNLDVMHIEKIFFEQLIHAVKDVKKKTCFTSNSVKDLKEVCQTQRKTNSFVLKKEEKKALCDWVSKLKFPDGYASDLSRCVDKKELKLHGLKSHDCHVFMERLLPIALRYLLPKNEWNAVTEISQFFRDLCASTIKTEKVTSLENNIAIIICKLEKIFPPSFFNSMEHLPIHLPYELKVGGPVQYRWMYPFERFLNHLKKKIGNKARVEGSICNAYLLEEISNFCSHYFEEHIETKSKALFATNDGEFTSELPEAFQEHLGRTSGACSIRFLEDKEYERAHIYVLSNIQSLGPYEERFNENSDHTLSFPQWLRGQVNDLKSDVLVALAMGPSRKVRTWKRYSINGFNFRAFKDGKDVPKASINNGVCVNSTEGVDYYGTLNEVIEMCYTGKVGSYKTVLFKCDWIDNSERGMDVHKEYKLVDVNRSKKYPTYDPFVCAHQVEQVYFAPYPNTKRDKDQWSAVFKTQARSHIDAPVDESIFQDVAASDATLSVIEGNEIEEEEVEDVEEDDEQGGNEAENDDGEDEDEAGDGKDEEGEDEAGRGKDDNDDNDDEDDDEDDLFDDLFPDNNDY